MAKKNRMKSTVDDCTGKKKQMPFFREAGRMFQTVEPWIPWILGGFYSIVMT